MIDKNTILNHMMGLTKDIENLKKEIATDKKQAIELIKKETDPKEIKELIDLLFDDDENMAIALKETYLK